MLDSAIAAKASRKAEFPTHGLFSSKQDAVADPRSGGEPENPRRRLTDEWEVEDVLAVIRDVVSIAAGIDRDEAIRDIARELGAERTGSRIRDFIESALNTASRRLIIQSENGLLFPRARSIEEYDRDFLKTALKNVVGRTWTDQDEAIRAATRWLGFRRTGHKIEDAFKSAIRGALRQNLMQRDGDRIRFVS
jgi:hypothetical protein